MQSSEATNTKVVILTRVDLISAVETLHYELYTDIPLDRMKTWYIYCGASGGTHGLARFCLALVTWMFNAFRDKRITERTAIEEADNDACPYSHCCFYEVVWNRDHIYYDQRHNNVYPLFFDNNA